MSYSKNQICEACGREGAKKCSALGMYLCNKHWMQYRSYGYLKDNNPRSIDDLNEINIVDNEAWIDLYNRRNEKTFTVIIDAEDVEKVKGRKWRATIKRGKPYVITGHGAGNLIYLARFLLNYSGEHEVDHIDGDTLNNKKSNLRIVTHQDNARNLKAKQRNKFGIRGVAYDKKCGKYTVDFSDKKIRYYMKPWNTLAEAVACRYYLELNVNPVFRFSGNDEKIASMISTLSEEQRYEIEQYVLNKLQSKNIEPLAEQKFLSKQIVEEDFIQYSKPSMFIANTTCNFKCDRENGSSICINCQLIKEPTIAVNIETLIQRYLSNPITSAVVFGGLENFDEFEQLFNFITRFRCYSTDDIVIYTGFSREEIEDKVELLKQFSNIIIKFGRFIPNQQPHYDEVLGVELASPNQYAERIS